MTDSRVKVKVIFTIDIGSFSDFKIFEAQDMAESITRKVFEESFSRAHLLKISCEELFETKHE